MQKAAGKAAIISKGGDGSGMGFRAGAALERQRHEPTFATFD